jgi:hypothetical protein
VYGSSVASDGVLGEGVVGVYGRNTSGNGNGVIGYSDTGRGVWGHSNQGGIGVLGESGIGTGVRGAGQTGGFFEGSVEGVHAVGPAGGLAGHFEGHVMVTGNHTCLGDMFLPGADCAEHFDMQSAVAIEPGSVVVIDDDGMLRQSGDAYDTKVAGVISGAGIYRPGIILDKQSSVMKTRQPVALVGKVFCKVDAQYSPIKVGDMLTSSPTPGHAMKAADPLRAFGAVIGKALDNLEAGTGMVRILVSLQ